MWISLYIIIMIKQLVQVNILLEKHFNQNIV